MALYTKGIYKPKEDSDGIRICVMNRLTEDNGKTPVEDLYTGKLFDLWIKKLSAPGKLVGSWYRKEIKWEEFEDRYLEYLSKEELKPHLNYVIDLGLKENVTLLCVEDTPEYCHRRILAQECERLNSELEVIIK